MQAVFSKALSVPLLERWVAALLEKGDWLPGNFFFSPVNSVGEGLFWHLNDICVKRKKLPL